MQKLSRSIIALMFSCSLVQGCTGIPFLPSEDKTQSEQGRTSASEALAFEVPERAIFASVPARDSVMVIDVDSKAVVGEIPAGDYPISLALKATRNILFAADYNADSVSFVNLKSKSTEAIVASGEKPTDISVSRSGNHLYVANSGDRTVARIDIEKQTRTQVFRFPNATFPNFRPRHVVPHPNLDQVYVISDTLVNGYGMVVKIIDNPTGIATIGSSYVINGAVQLGDGAVSGSGGLFISDRGTNYLWKIDLNTGAAYSISLPAPAFTVCASPDKPQLFASFLEGNSIGIIDTQSNSLSGTVQVPEILDSTGVQALAMSPFDASLWMAIPGSNGVAVVTKPDSEATVAAISYRSDKRFPAPVSDLVFLRTE